MKYININSKDELHNLLKNQLLRADEKNGNLNIDKFIEMVNQAYHEADFERNINENSMAVVSTEIMEANKELRAQSEALIKSREKYQLILEASNDVLWEWHINDSSVEYTDRFDRLENDKYTIQKETFKQWIKKIHVDDKSKIQKSLNLLKENKQNKIEIEFRFRESPYNFIWMHMRAISELDRNNQPIRVLASIANINKQKEYEAQLFHAAFHDRVTGISNRALFMDRLQQVIDRKKRIGEPMGAILFVDLDRFKFVNDTYGHEAGDFVLKTIAKKLSNVIRPGDTVSRFGGDEFLIILDDIDHFENAKQIADRIIEDLSKPIIWQKKYISLSASVGICKLDRSVECVDEIVRFADRAMYNAKSKGKSQYQIFDDNERAIMHKASKIEEYLPLSIKNKEIFVYYQPIIDLSTGAIESFETLVRWIHPTEGIVSPVDFIPIAEETGFINDIGEFVLKTACEQQHIWSEMTAPKSPPSISVNVSVKQLLDNKQFKRLIKIIDHAKIDPKYIKLEITESVIMSDPELVINKLFTLRQKGIILSIDDFGTGYSSLSYLHDFPFDVVKIDQSFISRINTDEKSYRLVNGIIGLAKDMGFVVVAEGIETSAQFNILKKMKCGYGQGYYFAKPLPEDIARFILIENVEYDDRYDPPVINIKTGT